METAVSEPSSTPASAATATPAPEATPEAPDLPRSVSYGDMTFTITQAVLSHASPRTYDRPGNPELVDQSYLYVHLTIQNDLKNVQQTLYASVFQLDAGGARRQAVSILGQAAASNIQPGTAVDYITGFEVADDLHFGDATLVIVDAGAIPALLPLTGAEPESPYPIDAKIETNSAQATSANPCSTSMLVQPLSAQIDLDAGIDQRGLDGNVDDGRRALEDQRFLRIEMRATGDSGQCGGANVQDKGFRLQIDGTPRGTVNHVNIALSNGEAVDFPLLYRVPADAKGLILLAGAPGGTVQQYQVTVSDFGP